MESWEELSQIFFCKENERDEPPKWTWFCIQNDYDKKKKWLKTYLLRYIINFDEILSHRKLFVSSLNLSYKPANHFQNAARHIWCANGMKIFSFIIHSKLNNLFLIEINSEILTNWPLTRSCQIQNFKKIYNCNEFTWAKSSSFVCIFLSIRHKFIELFALCAN